MLSIIVPIYNVEKYLSVCLESIVNQTYQDLEIILVNDGSTDNCDKICKKYAQTDKRIKIINKENGGLVSARKAGIKTAQGEYIAFVDGDDWIDPFMYQELLKAIEKFDVDLVDSGYIREKNGMSYIYKLGSKFYKLDDNIRHDLYKGMIGLDDSIGINPSIWSKVFKTDLIKKCYSKVPDDRSFGEDVISLIYCISEATSIYQMENVFYHYVYRESSIIHSRNIENIENVFELWKICKDLILNVDKKMSKKEMDFVLFRKLRQVLSAWETEEINLLQQYVFPHIDLLFDKKIAIYGAGKVGVDYVAQISKNERCDIVCWIDKNYKKYKYVYRKVHDIEQLFYKEIDLILIAVDSIKLADEIKRELISLRIPIEKIVWHKPIQQF